MSLEKETLIPTSAEELYGLNEEFYRQGLAQGLAHRSPKCNAAYEGSSLTAHLTGEVALSSKDYF